MSERKKEIMVHKEMLKIQIKTNESERLTFRYPTLQCNVHVHAILRHIHVHALVLLLNCSFWSLPSSSIPSSSLSPSLSPSLPPLSLSLFLSTELHDRIAKIDRLRKRYEILTMSMNPPEGEEEHSQTYYVIKVHSFLSYSHLFPPPPLLTGGSRTWRAAKRRRWSWC